MKVVRIVTALQIRLIYYFSVVLGVCPYIYSRSGNKATRSKALECYSLLIHLTSFLVCDPLGYKITQEHSGHFITKDFVIMIEIFATQMKIISGLLSILVFYRNRVKFDCFINQILKLNETTFKVSKENGEQIEKKLIGMVFLKAYLSGSIGGIFVSTFLQNVSITNWLHMATFSCSCCMITFHMFTDLYFYTAVGFLTKFFELTNKKLEQIHQDYKLQTTPTNQLKKRVEELTNLYGQLFHLHSFLIRVYEIQIVSSLLASFVSNVSAGFATYTLYRSDHVNLFAFGTYFILTITNYLDSYLTSVMCNKNCQLWRAATDIVGQFTTLRSDDGRFDKAVSFEFD